MKEERFFYQPDIELGELTKEDTQHAVRVLRMKEGDELWLMDGRGVFYRAEISAASNHRCAYHILETIVQEKTWLGHLHIAMAPTKLNDRTEWMTEKATEVGVDEFSFLDCQFSERRNLKTERLDKIVISAMKQSRKAWKPVINDIIPVKQFLDAPREGRKFICHCHDEIPRTSLQRKMEDVRCKREEGRDECCTVLIGPEGDFSLEEVQYALEHGYESVSLGDSRLRTETAALVALMTIRLGNNNQ